MIRCILRLHFWNKWAESSRADLKLGEKVVGRCYIQERRCDDCGLAQRKAETVWIEPRIGIRPADERSHFEKMWGCKLNEWSVLGGWR